MLSSQKIQFLAVYVLHFQIFFLVNKYQVNCNKPTFFGHCFVQIIYSKAIPFPRRDFVIPWLFDSTTTLSYSIQEPEFFSLLPERNNTNYLDDDFDIDDVQVDIVTGYFRFYFRLSDSCMLFLINTPTLNETLSTIRQSGHGTSEQVLFLIETSPLNEENEIINGFVKDLFNSEGIPFHAPIAFINKESNEIALFCYFCPSSNIEVLNASTKNTWNDLQSQYLRTNLNGYGNLVIIPESGGHTPAIDEPCLKHYDSKRRRTNLLGEHVNCPLDEMWIIGSLQPILNISLTLDTSRRIEGNNYQKWMLQCRVSEGIFQFIPNIYVYTNGSLIIAGKTDLNWMACLNVHHVQSFGPNIITVLDLTSWLILGGLLLLYGFILKNICKGFDLFWTLVGKELLHKHDRKSLFLFLIALSLLSYTYGSIVSAESMQLTEFPEFKMLLKKGYRFWLPEVRPLLVVFGSLSNWTKNAMGGYLGGNPLDPRYYFAGKGEQNITLHSNDALSLLKAAAKFKLFINSLSDRHIIQAVGRQMVSVNKNLICKVKSMSGVDLKADHTFRVWGYLSSRFSQLLTIINGEYARVSRLKQFKAQIRMRNLEITKTIKLFDPKPIDLTSAVGLCCAICLAVYLCVFICWGIVMFKHWRRMYLRHTLIPKSRISDLKSIQIKSTA
ncbi:unnamed protein product [Orchesella dallaii]|uniref:Uncharacterized protein n=1 Tax=Orchesella dallaii TaxID=48710 RepID=A0ABP1RVE0_9HEXA